jgi:hypothetical protein
VVVTRVVGEVVVVVGEVVVEVVVVDGVGEV